jgi:hypothetical protein
MPFAIALAVSVVLHAAAIVMPGWTLPGDSESEPQTLEAHLAPPPAAPAPVAAKRKPHSRSARHPAAAPASQLAPEAAATAAEQPAPAPVAAEAAPAPVVAPPLPPPPPMPPWPAQGRLHYVVKYGDNGFIIGETTQEWHIEDGRYSIRSVAEPRGLAALRGRTRTQTSEGEVTGAGLRPQAFRDQRDGRDAEAATFDWPGGQVTFSGGRAPARLAEGVQDLISVFYQLAWLAPRQDVDLAVATGSRLGRWTFEWVGEEKLELSAGAVGTLHLRARSDGDTTEVWLAPAYGGLPVRIRYVDRKGEAFEQTADSPDNK